MATQLHDTSFSITIRDDALDSAIKAVSRQLCRFKCWEDRYLQGEPWGWNQRSHQALDGGLREALRKIHEAGILHGDLHKGNILVTDEDRRIFILDFESSEMEATPEDMAEEMRNLTALQAMRVNCYPKANKSGSLSYHTAQLRCLWMETPVGAALPLAAAQVCCDAMQVAEQ